MEALSDPALLPQTVATVFGLREGSDSTLDQALLEHLAGKEMLLLLDNCEHMLEACAGFAGRTLQHAPALRILVTGREALGIGGEWPYPVPSLAYPEPGRPLSVEGLAEYEAVRLFLDRARTVQADFEVREDNAASVAEICSRLDGIPLAIELAAARTRLLPVGEIRERLDDRFRLLSGGGKAALPRHRTLRAAMDWSHQLLDEEEKTLLRRLSCFAGGWTLEAAEKVCPGGPIEGRDVLEILSRLVGKSLVQVQRGRGKARYRFLETVRQYARDHLMESGELEDTHDAHRDYFIDLAEAAAPALGGPDQARWLEALEAEHQNLRRALDWSWGVPDRALPGLRLAAVLWRFWDVRGHWGEGVEQVRRGLAECGEAAPDDLRAKASLTSGWLRFRQGAYAEARTLQEESLALHRELGDKAGAAQVLVTLGIMASDQSEFERAEASFRESEALYREMGDEPGAAQVLANRGVAAARQGEFEEARALYEESLALFEKQGHKTAVATLLNNLGALAGEAEDFESVRHYVERSLALREELGDKPGIAGSLHNLGAVAMDLGEYDEARKRLRESLELSRDIGDKYMQLHGLGRMARLAFVDGRVRRCVVLLAASLAIREAIGLPQPPIHQTQADELRDSARERMDPGEFQAAWEAGEAMGLAEAVSLALEEEGEG